MTDFSIIKQSQRHKKTFLAILFSSVLPTAQAGFFDDYNQTAQSFRANLTQPIPEETHKFLDKKAKGSDAALYLLEKGRLQQANHQYEESKKSFEAAFVLLEQRNNKAKISASELGFKALSLVSNDSVIPYKIPEYEQVLAHVYQAINFMALNNPESAGVEMRIAQRIQREIELAHTKEAEKAKEKAGSDNNQNFDEAFAGLDTIAGKVKNTYQNAYAFYMAATLWEALGEENDALVDFKKAYELQPNDFIKNDVKRLDMSSGKKSQQYPVVIFLEQGLVPQKIPNTFALPTPNGLINVSFASYNPSTYKSPTSLQVFVNGRPMTNTSTLTDIGALAVKTLKENVAANMTSQIARTTAKYMVQKELGNHLGAIGQIAGNIYNTASEKADVRAWNTLPSNAQVARLTLPTGTHTIQLKNGYMTQELNIDVKPNQTVFIHGIEANQEILTDSFAITH
ncbi:hypothetical protein JFY72_12480 [Acinetobacter sp. c1]|nr:hypothetical protein [Acinetobacter sp. c1]MBM0959187.1 hypothetical protein [Acinetobacter sp. C13]